MAGGCLFMSILENSESLMLDVLQGVAAVR
jgi:hypothetical protein